MSFKEYILMRSTMFGLTLTLCGCAGQPSAPQSMSAERPLANPERVVEARKMGYRLVNENGQTLYCRSEVLTGSHVERETVCLTVAQVDRLREQTQRGLMNVERQVPPPAGR